ncbi:oligosaccharide flippase family protein [Tenacibaculum aiptasiae]|uniref:oligosaccharide flippase family protein n=1 Tax=Tenacibaculum aiptasiae TaxID=426481 RepID=UPI003B593ABA
MSKESNSYKIALKSTSIFGGVQLFKIIIQIIKTKLIAILLGPTGLGLISLFTSSSSLISKLTNIGLDTSAVKEISESNSLNDAEYLGKKITIVKRIALVTGILGGIILLVLSPKMSVWTFGTTKYTISFMWLSLSLLLNQVTIGNNSIIQGTRKIKLLAKSNLIGSVFSLIVSVPAYYFFRNDAIIFVFVITSFLTTCLSFYYLKKINYPRVNIPIQQVVFQSKSLVKLGVIIALNGLIASLGAYLLQIYITEVGGAAQVGLFSAGFVIINTYVGLIFTAMGTDYFPRLTLVSNDNFKIKKVINEQSEIAIIILGPIIIGFIVCLKWIITILYSSKFLEVEDMLYWAALGMYFKAMAWAIAYVFLAKGDRKIYIYSETLVNVYTLAINIFGYHYFGLKGLGISFLIINLFFFTQVYIIALKKYSFSYGKQILKLISIQLVLGALCFILTKEVNTMISFFFTLIVFFSSILYSFKELDKRINLKELINRFRKK